jgi:hypothetical protein
VPDGTVTVGGLSGLVWLKNANCFGEQNYSQAVSSARNLKSGSCGLTDGSKAGDWRLPTIEELSKRQRKQSGFNNVQVRWYYWSSGPFVTHRRLSGSLKIILWEVKGDRAIVDRLRMYYHAV